MGDLSQYYGPDFDPNKEPEPDDFSALPDGKYPCMITETEIKGTQSGGEMLVVVFTVNSPDYEGRKIWGRFNLKNKSAKAVRISRAQFASLLRAAGIRQVHDSSELLNASVLVNVTTRKYTRDGEERVANEVKGYEPLHQPRRQAQPAQRPQAAPYG